MMSADSAGRQQVFTAIYHENAWGDAESKSGPGSSVARASLFREDFEQLLRDLGVRSLLDAPCGDFNWLSGFDLALDSFTGIDIVPQIIEQNRARYSGQNFRFEVLDIVSDALPAADLILCRDALVHFSFADVLSALRNFKRSGSQWLLTNTFVAHHANADITTGAWQPLNLQDPPFALPPPVRSLDEKCLGYGGVYRDKRLALWRLPDLEI